MALCTSAHLPIEIQEIIVSYYAEPIACTGKSPLWCRWSPTLLALHSTSIEFRACVLRVIGQCFSVQFDGSPDPNAKLRDLLLQSPPCPRLGSLDQYVRSLAICISDLRVHETLEHTPASQYFDLELLQYFCHRAPLRAFHLDSGIYGDGTATGIKYCVKWSKLPQEATEAFRRLQRLPGLEILGIAYTLLLPQNILDGVSAEEVSLANGTFTERASTTDTAVNNSITTLKIDSCDIPTAVSLPRLRYISGMGELSHDQVTDLWTIIDGASHVLESVEIYEYERESHPFPTSLNISDFPKLQSFIYHYNRGWTYDENPRVVLPQLEFLQGHKPAKLRYFELGIEATFVLFSEAQGFSIATDPAWPIVDILLANSRFEALEEVTVTFHIEGQFDLRPYTSDDAETRAEVRRVADDLSRRLSEAMSESFPRLHQSQVKLNVEAYAHIEEAYEERMVLLRGLQETRAENNRLRGIM